MNQPETGRDIYNVTRLNREVRSVLEGSFPTLWVEGEISNMATPASGHIYFSLKDKSSQVRCAMFKNRNRSLKFMPENGLQVVARANVSLYEGRGEFQLIVEELEPAGTGALQKAFEELKQRLHKEGLFDEQHKRPLPLFPKSIGVITSSSGAAIRDILNVLHRRYACADIIIYPVPVQGEGSAGKIVAAIELAHQRDECDVLILSRGGGSLEDLWSFNEETVARAIYAAHIPVICGVGHEIDFTIADFVADKRAPTPSAAAEMVSPDKYELMQRLSSLHNKLAAQTRYTLNTYIQLIGQLEKRLPHPARRLQNISQRLDDLSMRLQQATRTLITTKQSRVLVHRAEIDRHSPVQKLARYRDRSRHLGEQLHTGMTHYIYRIKEKVQRLAHGLNTISPLATLDRGYAIVTKAGTGSIIRDADELSKDELINTRFARGRIQSTVSKIIDDE